MEKNRNGDQSILRGDKNKKTTMTTTHAELEIGEEEEERRGANERRRQEEIEERWMLLLLWVASNGRRTEELPQTKVNVEEEEEYELGEDDE